MGELRPQKPIEHKPPQEVPSPEKLIPKEIQPVEKKIIGYDRVKNEFRFGVISAKTPQEIEALPKIGLSNLFGTMLVAEMMSDEDHQEQVLGQIIHFMRKVTSEDVGKLLKKRLEVVETPHDERILKRYSGRLIQAARNTDSKRYNEPALSTSDEYVESIKKVLTENGWINGKPTHVMHDDGIRDKQVTAILGDMVEESIRFYSNPNADLDGMARLEARLSDKVSPPMDRKIVRNTLSSKFAEINGKLEKRPLELFLKGVEISMNNAGLIRDFSDLEESDNFPKPINKVSKKSPTPTQQAAPRTVEGTKHADHDVTVHTLRETLPNVQKLIIVKMSTESAGFNKVLGGHFQGLGGVEKAKFQKDIGPVVMQIKKFGYENVTEPMKAFLGVYNSNPDLAMANIKPATDEAIQIKTGRLSKFREVLRKPVQDIEVVPPVKEKLPTVKPEESDKTESPKKPLNERVYDGLDDAFGIWRHGWLETPLKFLFRVKDKE